MAFLNNFGGYFTLNGIMMVSQMNAEQLTRLIDLIREVKE
tara:strand:+ start:2278 stop:2397 length:120 start_codon:yes stop_codon:yes gene_type:complete